VTVIYPPGAPCWLDLTCRIQSKAADFYEGLLGWRVRDDYANGFANFAVGEDRVAGIGPSGDRPASWNIYLCVANLEQTLADLPRFGGRRLVGPVDLGSDGRGGAGVDPTGAVFSLWEPRGFTGAALTGVTNTWCWTELITHDVNTAAQFYADVFGWVIDLQAIGEISYALARLNGAGVAGMVRPPGANLIHPAWTVTFAVLDVDATVARALELGGQVATPATDVPGLGRYAALGGVAGEAFSVVTRTVR
jgi:hypothetical protein